MDTHIQICTENQSGNCPVIYNGKYSDKDFINRDVIVGELLESMIKRLHEYDATPDDLMRAVDNGQKVIISLWREDMSVKPVVR